MLSLQKSEKERLLQERTELEQNLDEMQQSLCGLYKNVSIEPGSEQDHLQLLAKLSSQDFPISSSISVEKNDESQITIEMVSCSSECDRSEPPADSVQEDAGCSVPTSLLNACLDMNITL